MAESLINELLLGVSHDPPESDLKRQKLIKCVVTGKSKQYLGKDYTKEQVNELSSQEVDKQFNICEVKLSGQMVKALGKSIIKMGTCAVLRITNQDALSEDLESDPFTNLAFQRFMCWLYYRFGSFLALLSIGLIISRNYLSELGIKNGGTNAKRKTTNNLMSEQLTTLTKSWVCNGC